MQKLAANLSRKNEKEREKERRKKIKILDKLDPSDAVRILLEAAEGKWKLRPGLEETPARFAKAWSHFTSGYHVSPEQVLKCFADGAEDFDEMVIQTGIPVWSLCEHHLLPFFGKATVAYIPDKRIVGLSKLTRLVEVFSRRLQVQERLTVQIATTFKEVVAPLGVAVSMTCRHTCIESRGVCKAGELTTTTKLLGVFKTDSSARAEFLQQRTNEA